MSTYPGTHLRSVIDYRARSPSSMVGWITVLKSPNCCISPNIYNKVFPLADRVQWSQPGRLKRSGAPGCLVSLLWREINSYCSEGTQLLVIPLMWKPIKESGERDYKPARQHWRGWSAHIISRYGCFTPAAVRQCCRKYNTAYGICCVLVPSIEVKTQIIRQ